MKETFADPKDDPLAQERGTRKMTSRRIALLAAGLIGAAAFAFGAVHMGRSLGTADTGPAAEGAAHNAEALTP
jgi:hypothetical protein